MFQHGAAREDEVSSGSCLVTADRSERSAESSAPLQRHQHGHWYLRLQPVGASNDGFCFAIASERSGGHVH
jgi:hypothetical protein